MKLVAGMLEREQNARDIADSCFDTSCVEHQLENIPQEKYSQEMRAWLVGINTDQFLRGDPLRLVRHPEASTPVSGDTAHMHAINRGFVLPGLQQNSLRQIGFWPRTLDGRLVSVGFWALIHQQKWLVDLSLLVQWILFLIPVRWNDDHDPATPRIQWGYKHHAGDYRLFKQLLWDSWVRHLVRASTLRYMSRVYWAPEPNNKLLLEIDDLYITALKGK